MSKSEPPPRETVEQGPTEPAGLGARELTTIGAPGTVPAVAFSPDGNHLALGCDGGRTVITDLAGRQQAKIRDSLLAVRVNDVAYDSDGRRFATVSSDQIARVWDANTNLRIRKLGNMGSDGGDGSSTASLSVI
ncbi:MAG: hypothetical protein ABSA93_12640 [Streptosporangiaceae bacterium]|jgi:WD repeat-containing protein 1 (actin-interacting protein 1)